MRILVVDDDADIRELLGRYLETQGFEVALAASARECVAAVATRPVDLVVLDVMLPDESGLDVCRRLNDEQPSLPVILLTALKEDVDRIIGLEIGADDYLGKPFNPRELVARIRAVLRRQGPGAARNGAAEAPARELCYRFEGYVADTTSRSVTDAEGREIALTGTEFDLLCIFLDRPGRLLSRDTLSEHLYGRVSSDPLDRTVDVAMSRLRRKFGDNGVFRLFKTVRNGGYQLTARVVPEPRGP
ncbi:DNA-binding response regulator [Aureimonas flava]|uniref:DNA-binding response regulator n=1 Tax=Aureimonas flava TaxID=2320271 RepID=A0A3A1WND8_9HYPH|nr:response regulator transcription factor [Aureimonas flava]RIY01383.1 DNA-binding response regulator [Aureimonas flava]